MLRHEVAHPDRADPAVGEQRLEGAIGLEGAVERRRQRLMQEQQVELSDAESAMLLPYLCRWIHEPRFTVRYRWSAGTVAMWDNRTTQHHVLNDFRGVRVIQRVTVMGDEVEAAEPPRWPAYGSKTATFWRDQPMRQQLKRQRPRPT